MHLKVYPLNFCCSYVYMCVALIYAVVRNSSASLAADLKLSESSDSETDDSVRNGRPEFTLYDVLHMGKTLDIYVFTCVAIGVVLSGPTSIVPGSHSEEQVRRINDHRASVNFRYRCCYCFI